MVNLPLRGAVYHMGRHHGGAGKCPIFHQFHGIGRPLIAVTAYETVHLRVLLNPLIPGAMTSEFPAVFGIIIRVR